MWEYLGAAFPGIAEENLRQYFLHRGFAAPQPGLPQPVRLVNRVVARSRILRGGTELTLKDTARISLANPLTIGWRRGIWE
jgi:hypothetical protein